MHINTKATTNNETKSFKEFTPKQKEKIAHEVEKRAKETLLSPIVEDYIYFTNRALDYGDFNRSLEMAHPKYGQWQEVVNKNADYFDTTILHEDVPDRGMKRYETFRDAGLYINHQSDDPQLSVGFVFDVYDFMDVVKEDSMHITLLSGLDVKKAPKIARTFQQYPKKVATSMGCTISSSICTICGKEVFSDNDLCDHLRYSRGKLIGGRKVAEFLKGVEFYEDSIVNVPAAPTAMVIDAVSEIIPGRMLKIAKQTSKDDVILQLMTNIYNAIRTASTLKEKQRLSDNLDQLIIKLEAREECLN